jgi:hypothetical protein
VNKTDSTRRSIHTIVTDETHTAFKATCVQQKLTMQDFLEECINRLLDGDEDFMKFAAEISRRKKEKVIKRVSNTDADAVYRAINGG